LNLTFVLNVGDINPILISSASFLLRDIRARYYRSSSFLAGSTHFVSPRLTASKNSYIFLERCRNTTITKSVGYMRLLHDHPKKQQNETKKCYSDR